MDALIRMSLTPPVASLCKPNDESGLGLNGRCQVPMML